MTALVARYTMLALAVLLLNFLLPRLLPGDPLDFDSAEGMNAAVAVLPAQARAELRAQYHLDDPLPAQLRAYIADLARGDLGWSISRSAPVAALIAERLPWTLALVLTATLVASALGVGLGLLTAWRGGWTSRLILGTATALAALPEFLVAMLLLLLFAIGLEWFPLTGGQVTFAPPADDLTGWLVVLGNRLRRLMLPGVTLALAATAGFVLLTRGAVASVLGAPFLTTARAKGVREMRVALRHALPNALLPILTLFGIRLGHVLGGAIVVERVFGIPGVGFLAFEAVRARDYPVIQAVFLLSSMAVLVANLATELLYRWIDPRQASAGR